MNPRQILRTGIAASAAAHLSLLTLVLFFADVHPFSSVTAEPITVDIVSEAPPALKEPQKEDPVPEPKEKPTDAFDLSTKSALASPPPPADPKPAGAIQSQQLAERSALPPSTQQASTRPQHAATAPAAPAYVPPEPDLSIKYHVMLGLPPDLSAEPPKGKAGDDFDTQASKAADIDSNIVAEFRRHLKTCSKLPESVAPADQIRITLRVLMTPDGRLAAEPILIEASASAKGPALMQSAISALEACQPYAMLPLERYGEWRMLDLRFTPTDF
jgi:hypothetical protein